MMVFGLCTMIVENFMLDYVMNTRRESVQFLIFSEKYDEIASGINSLHRGVTVLNGQGWYTKQERKVLIVLAKRREANTIFRIILSIDPNAFVSQTRASGVFAMASTASSCAPTPTWIVPRSKNESEGGQRSSRQQFRKKK